MGSERRMEKRIIEEIKKIIQDFKRVLTDITDLYSYAYDASFGTFLPDVVVQPWSKEEIVALVKLANKERLPIYPRGQATGLSGGPYL